MNIGIMEDNNEELEVLSTYIDTFFRYKDAHYNVKTYINLDDVYADLEELNLIFLDIELGNGNNGIDIGMEIRKRNADVRIIFNTNFNQYSIAGYKVRADRYLLKSLSQTQFNVEMETVLENYLFRYTGFKDFKISNAKIYYKDVMYIEFKSRKSILYLKNYKVYQTGYSLKYWIEKLPKEFFAQPYQSYIINMNYISGFKKNSIILMNDEYIPISRTYEKSFYDTYAKFVNRKI